MIATSPSALIGLRFANASAAETVHSSFNRRGGWHVCEAVDLGGIARPRCHRTASAPVQHAHLQRAATWKAGKQRPIHRLFRAQHGELRGDGSPRCLRRVSERSASTLTPIAPELIAARERQGCAQPAVRMRNKLREQKAWNLLHHLISLCNEPARHRIAARSEDNVEGPGRLLGG